MPKSKKKKVKHQDFAKVKLKVGKKLPRAANETDASFKSHAIQLRDQFKSDGTELEELTTKKKLKIGDILTQCHHYSPDTRRDALVNLRDVALSTPQEIDKNLSAVLLQCAELFSDSASIVRSAVVKVLKAIFPKVPLVTIKPFFAIISAHLSCAMTHISENIQFDSLRILDVTLDHYPELVVTSSNKLLVNFLEQISRYSSGTSESEKRMLYVNPGGKIGSNKWRIDVLNRLGKVLKAVLGRKPNVKTNYHDSSQTNSVDWKDVKSNMQLNSYVGWNTPGFTLGGEARRDDSGDLEVLYGGHSLQSFIKTLIPLLLQCWMEAAPILLNSHLAGNDSGIDPLSTLSSVLAVLVQLLEYSSTHQDNGDTMLWIKKTYLSDFLSYFMANFPFSTDEAMSSKKSKAGSASKVSASYVNLAVCKMMSYFMDSTCEEEWFRSIVDHFSNLNNCKLSTEELKMSLCVYQTLLTIRLDPVMQQNLLATVLDMLKSKHSKSAEFGMLLDFFGRIYLDERNHSLKCHEAYESLVGMFPRILNELTRDGENESALASTFHIIKSACIQEDKCMAKILHDNFYMFADASFVSRLSTQHKYDLMIILVSLKTFHASYLKKLSLLFLGDSLESKIQSYTLHILHSRISCASVSVKFGEYLAFLFTLLVGQTKEQMKCVQQIENPETSHFTIESTSEYSNSWSTIQCRIQCVLEQCGLVDISAETVAEVWTHFVTELLADVHQMSPLCAYSLLQGTSTMLSCGHQSTTKFRTLLAHIVLALMPAIQNPTSQVSSTIEDMNKFMFQSCIQCIRCTIGLWTVIMQLASETLKQRTGQQASEILMAVQQLSTNDTLKPIIVVDMAQLKALLKEIKSLHPDLEASVMYSAIDYHLSVI